MEKHTFLDSVASKRSDHTFVTGLARSGTTILLRAIHESSQHASLTYADMPFVLAPNSWRKLQRKNTDKMQTERAHGDGVLVDVESPEAFEEVFWLTFDEPEASIYFEEYIHLILRRYEKDRYLSKNNQNVKRLSSLLPIFPDATFLIPFRDPLQHAQSLLAQHVRFCESQSEDIFIKSYMDWIGHSEFGLGYKPVVSSDLQYPDPSTLDHWLEQWWKLYEKLLTQYASNDKVMFVCYEDLCTDESVWDQIQDRLSLDPKKKYSFRESRKSIEYAFNEAQLLKTSKVYVDLRAL